MRALLTLAIVMTTGLSALAQQAQEQVTRVTLPDRRTIILDYYAINTDCTPVEWVELRVLKGPSQGEMSIEDRTIPIQFADPNPRKSCNGKLAPGKTIYYTAKTDFKGEESVNVESFNSTGASRVTTIKIQVK